MLRTYQDLIKQYSNYGNPKTKIERLVRQQVLKKLKCGLYEDDLENDHSIRYANYLVCPSYISLHYALSYYSLIPEIVYEITSVTTKTKKKQDFLLSNNILYSYRDIPYKAYYVGITEMDLGVGNENVQFATREKAICDILYTYKNLRSIRDVKELLFDDLRVNEWQFYELNPIKMMDIASLYPSTTLKAFSKFVKKELHNGKFIINKKIRSIQNN